MCGIGWPGTRHGPRRRRTAIDAFADADDAAISPEGRYVAFDIDSEEYNEAVDTNDDYDVYLKDLNTFYTEPRTLWQPLPGVAPKRLLDTAARGRKLTAGYRSTSPQPAGDHGRAVRRQAVVVNLTSPPPRPRPRRIS